jgi:hypothetical protein
VYDVAVVPMMMISNGDDDENVDCIVLVLVFGSNC